MTAEYTLGKLERLKSNLSIQDLLKNGMSLSEYPFKIYWNTSEDQQQKFPARVAISVPKRKFKRAVDRNRMKRRIRESYRRNKLILYQPLLKKNIKINVLILFLSDEFISFPTIDERISELLRLLVNKLPD